MAMGKRATERQEELFIAHDRLPKSVGHVFYVQLNKLLAEADFDQWVEAICAPYVCEGERSPFDPARCLLSDAPGRILRRPWLAAGHCLAVQ